MNLLVSRKKLLGNTGDFLWSYGGYLIVSALCDLCGVILDESNARNFIADCIESLYDTLKANLSVNGANYSLSLNDDLISNFIDFYLGIYGRKYLYNNGDECEEITGGYVIDKLEDYAQTTYSIKLDDHIQLRTNHVSNKHTMAGIESVNKINFNTLFNEGYKTIKADIEFVNAVDSVNNYSRVLLLNQVMSSDYKEPNTTWSAFDVKMDLGRINDYVGRKILSAELNSDLTSHFIGAYSSMMSNASLESFVNIYSIYLGRQYNISDSYVKSLEEYKAKYEKESTEIILDSSIVNIKTKWKKESTDIYISDGNVENLPDGMSIVYKKYLFKEGDQCTDLTGGYEAFGSSTINSNNLYIFYGGVTVKNIIDISGYTTLVLDIEYVSNFEDTYQGYSQFTNQNISSYQSIYYKIPTEAQKRGLVRVSLRSAIDNGNNYLYAPARGDDKMLNYKIYNIWLE